MNEHATRPCMRGRWLPHEKSKRSHADELRHLMDPDKKRAFHLTLSKKLIEDLERAGILEPQRGRQRRYGTRNLSSLIDVLLKRELAQHQQHQQTHP